MKILLFFETSVWSRAAHPQSAQQIPNRRLERRFAIPVNIESQNPKHVHRDLNEHLMRSLGRRQQLFGDATSQEARTESIGKHK